LLMASVAVAAPAAPADAAVALVTDAAALVNPLIGTKDGGNTFPGPSAPFGMIQWGPDSAPRAPGGGYDYASTAISGFGLNRMSGAGCYDFGDVPFLPVTGAPPADKNAATVGINHANESASPGSYTLTLNNGVRTELTGTRRAGLARFTFPAAQQATLLVKAAGGSAVSDAAVSAVGTTEVTGSVGNGAFCARGNHYQLYFAVSFDRSFTSATTWAPPGFVTGVGGIALAFPTGSVVQAKVGISFVSVANARANRDTLAGWDLAGTRQASRAEWNTLLTRIQIGGGSTAEQTTFYTALYHSLLHPNVFSDSNRQYRGFDGQVRTLPVGQGDQYANFSGWDVYRSQIQLASLVAPAVMSDFVTSMLNDYDQSGRLPKWSVAHGETYVMAGDPAIPAIASAYAFGARTFDTAKALAAMTAQAARPGNIRPGNVYLDNLGYLPENAGYGCCEHYATTSTSLEYNVADFALAAYAGSLGDAATQARFADRAQGWQYLLHPGSGFMQPRLSNGQWRSGFDPTDPSLSDWAEGNSWKYTPMVPFNARGLINAKGGDAAMVQYLNTHFGALNEPAGEHAWMGNEPSLGTPWLYDWTGTPYLTQAVVRRIQTGLYRNAPDGLPGNDDLGSMSSWYVFSALGFYPAIPGTADLALGSPMFPQAVVHLPNGRTLTLNAPAATVTALYIQSMTVNAAAWNRAYLPAALLTDGAAVDFALGTSANASWASASDAAPPSYQTNAIAVANNQGTSNDSAPGQSNYDQWGSGYSVQALATAGVVPGSALTAAGIRFTWPNTRSGLPDNVIAAGQRLAVASPPGATRLGLLGSAEGNAAGAAGTAVVYYADGTTQQAPVGFSDWTLGGGQSSLRSDNAVAATMPYRNNWLVGGTEQITTYLLATSVAIDPAKTVIGVTLPAQPAAGRIHVFAVGFGGHLDNAGSSDDGYVGGADFDGIGSSYSRQALAAAGFGPGATITRDSVRYTWPVKSAGERDNMIAAGQTIAVTPVASTTKLGLLGAADGWGASGVATINYADGTRQQVTLGFTDWTRAGGQLPISYGNTVAAQLPYRNYAIWGGGKETVATYVFAATFALLPGKTVQSITLPARPDGGRLHVFAVGVG